MKLFCTALFLFLVPITNAQSNYLDSLKNIKSACVQTCIGDTTKLGLLSAYTEQCELEDILKCAEPAIALADAILNNVKELKPEQKKVVLKHKVRAVSNGGFFYQQTGNNPRALNAYAKSIKVFNELNDKKGAADVLNNIGFIYNFGGDFYKALELYNLSLKLREEAGDSSGIAMALYNLAATYEKRGNVEKGLDYFYKSLKLYEAMGNKKAVANVLNNIASVYSGHGETEKAFENYNRSLKLYEEAGSKSGIATLLHNIGMMYSESKVRDLEKALGYFNRSLKISEEIGHKKGVATLHTSIGNIYEKRGDPQKSHEYYSKSLQMFREMRDPEGIAMSFAHVGDALKDQKKYKEALTSSIEGNELAKKLGFVDILRNTEESVYSIYHAMGNDEAAFEHYKKFIIYNDSINSVRSREAGIKHQLNYEFEKKEAVLKEQQEKERVIAQEKNQRQQIIICVVVAGLLLVIGFALVVARSLKLTRLQKVIIEEKQREILDSIHYAKRIQTSLLPTEKYMARHLSSPARVLK